MKKPAFAFLLFLLALTLNAQDLFTNPVISGDLADPTIIRIGDTYYAAGTSSEWAPHYPVFESTDLVNWTQTGHIFNEKPGWTVSSFWAPELFYHNGRVYCYYTARSANNNISYVGVASADHPTQQFTDHGPLIEFGTEAIDAFVFDDGGQLYISWKAYGLDERNIELLGSKLSADGLNLEGEPFSLLVDDEDIGMEGQYHFKHGDYYYIIYAAHGCCGPESDYDVYVARAKDFAGPYEKFGGNPILHGGEGDIMSCGHGTMVTTPDGRMFYMCHAYFNGDRFFMGRQPILQEMIMTDDGWIQFKTGSLAVVNQPAPFTGTIQQPVCGFEDDFTDQNLKVDWTWNYPFSEHEITLGGGVLTLSGDMKSNATQGTALCIRPQTPDYEYQTRVNNTNGSFKGLTMYGSDRHLVALGIENDEIIVKTVRGGEETVLRFPNRPSDTYLKIRVEKGRVFTFYTSGDGKIWKQLDMELGDGQNFVQWDRIARPGFIHIGSPDEAAEFSYFKMENLDK